MTIREQILLDLKEIGNPKLLYQILEFIRILKKNLMEPDGNRNKVLQFAGTISDEEAINLQQEINQEFSGIEGEW